MVSSVELDRARRELDLLRKAQMIQSASGVAPYEERKAVAAKASAILREIELLEAAE